MNAKLKSAFLTVRVPAHVRTQFLAKAFKYGPPSTVLREIVEAFIDDRLTIKPVIRKGALYE